MGYASTKALVLHVEYTVIMTTPLSHLLFQVQLLNELGKNPFSEAIGGAAVRLYLLTQRRKRRTLLKVHNQVAFLAPGYLLVEQLTSE